jgi:hypothetical protein
VNTCPERDIRERLILMQEILATVQFGFIGKNKVED